MLIFTLFICLFLLSCLIIYLSSFCFLLDKESAFCKVTVNNWKDDHKNMVKVLGFLLGFYTATVMSRWWSQITHMPMITDVTMVLNGIVKCTVKSAVKY